MAEVPLTAPGALERALGRLVEAGLTDSGHLAAALGLHPHQIGRPLRKLTLAGMVAREPTGQLWLTPAGRGWLGLIHAAVEPLPAVAAPEPARPARPAATSARLAPLEAEQALASTLAEAVEVEDGPVAADAERAPRVAVRAGWRRPAARVPNRLREDWPRRTVRMLYAARAPWRRRRERAPRDARAAWPDRAERAQHGARAGWPGERALDGVRARWHRAEDALNGSRAAWRRVAGLLDGVRAAWRERVARVLKRVGRAGGGGGGGGGRRRLAVGVATVAVLASGIRLMLLAWPIAGGAPTLEVAASHAAGRAAAAAVSTPATPTPTPAPAPAPTLAAPAPAEQWVVVSSTHGLGLVLRPAPASTARILTLAEGARLRVTGEPVQQAGRAWLPVASQSGKTGWVAGEFVARAP